MKKSVSELQDLARKSRILILKMVHRANSGHFGGPLSCIDMMTALYFYKMRYDAKNPTWTDRDRFILSAGHKCAALYATLIQLGTIPENDMWTFRQFGSPLQGHPKLNLQYGIEMSTGSLGQGNGIGNGMALAARADKKDYRTYSLESDGGAQEGMFWEACMFAGHYKLDNRCILIDHNNVQIDGYVSDVMDVNPFADKLRAFKWHVIPVNGHDMGEICAALDEAEKTKGKPTAILGKTVLGKGVSIFENKPKYHGVPPTDDELKIGLQELGGSI
jgi:transketolase